ncbi:hypothetical protein EV122DRAFT_275012 [Schizophyllum commune]
MTLQKRRVRCRYVRNPDSQNPISDCHAGWQNCPWVHPEDPEWPTTRNYPRHEDRNAVAPSAPPPLRFDVNEEPQPRSAFGRSSAAGRQPAAPVPHRGPPPPDDTFDRAGWALPSRSNSSNRTPHRDAPVVKFENGSTSTRPSLPVDKGKGREGLPSGSSSLFGWKSGETKSSVSTESGGDDRVNASSGVGNVGGWGIGGDDWDTGDSGWGGPSTWDTQPAATPAAPAVPPPSFKKLDTPRALSSQIPVKKLPKKPDMPPPPPPPSSSPIRPGPSSSRAEVPSPRAAVPSPERNVTRPQTPPSPAVTTSRPPERRSLSKPPKTRFKPDEAAMAHHPKRAEAYVEVVHAMLAVIRCKIASVETHERYERWRKARSSADYAHASVRAQEMINDDSTELRRARDKAKADLKKALAQLSSVCADKDVFTPPPTFDADRDYEEVKRYTAELNAWLGRIAPAFATLPVLPDPEAPAPESNANAGHPSTTPDDLMDVDEEFREVPPTDLHTRLKLLDAEIEKYKRDEYDYAPPASNIAAEKEEQIRARLEPRVAAAVKARKMEMADHTAARMQRIDEVMETRAKESVASLGQIRANQLLIMQLRAKKAENEAIKERIAAKKDECDALEAQVHSLNDGLVKLLARDPVPQHPLPRQQEGITPEALEKYMQPAVDRIVQGIYDKEVLSALEAMSLSAGKFEAEVRKNIEPDLQKALDIMKQLKQVLPA